MIGGENRFLFVISFMLLTTIYSCQDCDDCGPLFKEPVVNVKFINQDSLTAVQLGLETLDATVESINASLSVINDSLSFYRDSLRSVDLQITNGIEGLDDLRAALDEKIIELDTTFSEFQQLIIEENEKISVLSSIETDILSGKVLVDSLISKADMKVGDFGTDSLTNFLFPLSINDDSTAYSVFISGEAFDISLEYNRKFEEDERSRIEVLVSDIRVKGSTFNKVELNCEGCLSNETTITAYF